LSVSYGLYQRWAWCRGRCICI